MHSELFEGLRDRVGRRGMTLIEILVVVILVGSFVPATTASLSKQTQRQAANLSRELAVQLAEEGVELILAGGFFHWYGIVRPTGAAPVPTNPPYSISQGTGASVLTADSTLTVLATGAASDDPFNPFVGDLAATPAPLTAMTLKPWNKFRRDYVITSRGTSGTNPRLLECTVKVAYGPDATDVVTIPLYLGNHHPASASYRGLLWPQANSTTLTGTNPISGLTVSPAGRQLWGKPPGQLESRPGFYDSSFPVGNDFLN